MGKSKVSSVLLVGLLVFSTLVVGGAGNAVAGNVGNDAKTWAQFGYNGQNTGFNPNSAAPTTNVVERWTVTTDSTEAHSPVVSNGTVYFTDSNNSVYAVNATTGETIWEYSRQGTVYGTPAVSNGTVYFGWDYFDDNTPNKIFAVDAATGEQVWRFDFDGAPTSPTVANDTVYFAAELGTIFAVNATTGTEVWNYTADTEFRSDVAVGNEAVYASGDDRTIYGANRTTGNEEFNLVLYNHQSSSVTIWNGSLYYGMETGGVEAYPIDGGSSWELSTNGDVRTSVAIWNGRTYAATASGNLVAIDAVEGSVYWNQTISKGDFVSTPAVANGVVYISSNSDVYAVNATSGQILWNRTVGDHANMPIVADGVLYAGDSNGTVNALTEYSNLEPPNFRLSNVTTNEQVPVGERLNVTATVSNHGERSGTQTLELVVNGTVRDSASVSLAEQSSDRRTLSWVNATVGNHTLTVRTANDTISRHITVRKESDDDDEGSGGDDGGDDTGSGGSSVGSGGSSGGGSSGGGGGAPPPSIQVEVVAAGDDYRRSKVVNARADNPASVSLSGLGTEGASFDSLRITPESAEAEPRFFVNASTVESPGVTGPTEGEVLAYLSVETTYIESSALASASIIFRVPAEGTDPKGVTLYHRTNGTWEALSTDLVGERGGDYVFRAETTGFSLFAVGKTDSASIGGETATATKTPTSGPVEVTATTTDKAPEQTTERTTDAPAETTQSSGAVGHDASSVLVPLVALLLALGYRTRDD